MRPRRRLLGRMRPELRWAIAAAVALAVGATLAAPIARLLTPLDELEARALSLGHPWTITSVDLGLSKSKLSEELQLRGLVRRQREDAYPSAQVVGRVQVGEVAETPLVFWTLLLTWPVASMRRQLVRASCGVPIYCLVEGATTAAQLVLPMAQASAILAGNRDPITAWDHWSRFLEAGGQFAVAAAAALLTIGLTRTRS